MARASFARCRASASHYLPLHCTRIHSTIDCRTQVSTSMVQLSFFMSALTTIPRSSHCQLTRRPLLPNWSRRLGLPLAAKIGRWATSPLTCTECPTSHQQASVDLLVPLWYVNPHRSHFPCLAFSPSLRFGFHIMLHNLDAARVASLRARRFAAGTLKTAQPLATRVTAFHDARAFQETIHKGVDHALKLAIEHVHLHHANEGSGSDDDAATGSNTMLPRSAVFSTSPRGLQLASEPTEFQSFHMDAAFDIVKGLFLCWLPIFVPSAH